MASTLHVERYSLFVGTAMCGIGFFLFMNFSMQDFLTPGLIEKGVVIENAEIHGGSSVSGILNVNEISKPLNLAVSNSDPPTEFELRIEKLDGIIIHKVVLEGGQIEFSPDRVGEYQVFIKNLSSKSAVVSVIYGSSSPSGKGSLFIAALWMLLVISGNYLIIHHHFSKRNRYLSGE